MTKYAELHCLTNFTFLRGASHPEELVARAQALGYAALAVTDECSMAGIVRAHVAARGSALRLIAGTELSLDPGPGMRTALKLVLLATDRDGYGHLCELITRGRRRAAKGRYRLDAADVAGGLPGCLALWLPGDGPDPEPAAFFANAFPGRAWIGVELLAAAGDRARLDALHGLSRRSGLPLVACGDVHMHVRGRRALQDTLTATRLRCTIAEAGLRLHPNGERHLRAPAVLERLYPPELLAETVAIAERCSFSLDTLRYEYPEELVPPGETPAGWLRKLTEEGFARRFGGSGTAGAHGAPYVLGEPAGAAAPEGGISKLTEEGFARRFGSNGTAGAHGAPHVLCEPAPRCLAGAAPVLREPAPPSPAAGGPAPGAAPGAATGEVTREATRTDGAHGAPYVPCEAAPSWPAAAAPGDGVARARELVEHELALIAELGYEPYFLTVHDIVRFARERGILCQGRGSAANSAVCYCLGITEVDPSRMSMLFERFISRERNEPPDIDVDFEHQRREEVMQYIYAKYGRDRAALTATVISYRPKSALRDVGRALGMEAAQVDRLTRSMAWWDGRQVIAERIAAAGFDPASPVIHRLMTLVNALVGFPRHLSQHTGGFVIARGALSRLVPVENAAMPERTVIQWDKDDLDAIGLLKVDCLALGMLSAIRRAIDLVNGYRAGEPGRVPLTMAAIPPEDPRVYDMICAADTTGVFQIESRAQMAMLPRLAPRNFYDLVVEVAIVRPGPIQGGMVHPYLRRRQGIEPVTYPSEAVRSVLERTLGVPIFQEQVMQLAIVAAGFTPGESDQLRRSMAAWRRKGGLEHFEGRLVAGMKARGYGEDFARQIYQQILGFGEYGFPESHSASFALLVYVSSWLKCHEPAAFCAALINSQPMGFYAPAQLVQDARRHGVAVRPVDVTASSHDCTLEPAGTACPPALRLGLRMVGGLAEAASLRIVAARAQQPYADADDLARRADLTRRDLRALADAGALAPLAGHRREAAWAVAGIEHAPPLLAGAPIRESAPALPAPTEGQDIVADYRSLGLTLGRHPLALLRSRLAGMRLSTAEDIRRMPHGRLARTAGLVIGRQRPDTASGVIFVTLEDETGCVNVVVWNALAERQRRELLGSRLLAVHGRIERDEAAGGRRGEVVHLLAGHLADHSHLLGGLLAKSRDFH